MKDVPLHLLVSLLTEALDHITDKPWDDRTHLHARISEALGLPVQYAEHIAAVKREQEREENDGA